MTQQVESMVALTEASEVATRSASEPAPITYEAGPYERFVKPAMDFVGGFLLLLIAAPAMVLIAIAVWIDLGNPVILRQQRVGRKGKMFRVYKFRTMQPDRRRQFNGQSNSSTNGEERRVVHKSEDDPRLTGLGRFLRKWSLDELPQLLNVLAGQMSLVGPRPEMVSIVDQYEPWQHQRHVVKPGVTGLWQVSARGDTMMHEATHIDIAYIEQISFGADVKILLKTIPAALGSRTGH